MAKKNIPAPQRAGTKLTESLAMYAGLKRLELADPHEHDRLVLALARLVGRSRAEKKVEHRST